MADYIERQAAIDAFNRIKNTLKNPETAHYDTLMFYEIEDVLEDIEPADVVQVVRCENCVHWSDSNQCERPELAGNRWHDDKYFETLPDDFCSYGERKED